MSCWKFFYYYFHFQGSSEKFIVLRSVSQPIGFCGWGRAGPGALRIPLQPKPNCPCSLANYCQICKNNGPRWISNLHSLYKWYGMCDVMGLFSPGWLGYVSLGCNFMGYTFGYFGIWGCDFSKKKCLMGYIGIWPKMAVMGHDYIYFLLLDAFVGYILTYFIVRKIW